MTIVFDTGALIALDRAERAVWVRLKAVSTNRQAGALKAPMALRTCRAFWSGDV